MITSITKEQEAQIPVYIEKWVNKASEPIGRVKTVKITKELFGEEKTVLIAESIQNAIDIVHLISGGKKVEYNSQLDSQLGSQLDSQLRSQLGSQLYSQLRSQLDSQLRSQLGSQLYSQLGSQLGSQLDSQLDSQLYSQLDSQLGSQLYSQLNSQLRSQLDSQLYSQLYSQLDSQLDSQLYSQLYSQLRSQLGSAKIAYSFYNVQFWYAWYGYYDFAKSIGVKFDEEKFNRMGDIILNIPTIITLGEILIVIENPKCRWSNGNLHHDKLPAIQWSDGTGMYFLNAVKFEKELFERVTSGNVTAKEILNIKDVDQRTQAMRFLPPDDMVKELKGELLDTYQKFTQTGEVVEYKLYKFPRGEVFSVDAYYMLMDCPSTGKKHLEGVEVSKTVPQAMAWRHEITQKEFKLMVPLVHEV